MMVVQRTHGGPGPNGPWRFDFSTTANGCGPCPEVLRAVRQADHAHYPDPAHTHVRRALADFHAVEPERVLLAASASEFIMRLTSLGQGPVGVPTHGYADYAAAARVYGRPVFAHMEGADWPDQPPSLLWWTDPASPSGCTPAPGGTQQPMSMVIVVDRAAEPLRLKGQSAWTGRAADAVFQLYSPNKALGLTGVRGAYALAPAHALGHRWAERLEAACPSWPLGAAGVALLLGWVRPSVQGWLAQSLQRLRRWQQTQWQGLRQRGFVVQDSDTPYALVNHPGMVSVGQFTPFNGALNEAGLAWRDATSKGLPGHWRVSVQPPAAQRALWAVLDGAAAPLFSSAP